MEKPPSPASSLAPRPLLIPRALIPSLSLQPNTRPWPGQGHTVLTGKTTERPTGDGVQTGEVNHYFCLPP